MSVPQYLPHYYAENNKCTFFKSCNYHIKNSVLELSYKVILPLSSHFESLKPTAGKILYRILLNDSDLVNLKTAKIFNKYLVQTMKNTPSIKVFNKRDLSGTSEIYTDMRKKCKKALAEASPQDLLEVAFNYKEGEVRDLVIKKAEKKGIQLGPELTDYEKLIKIVNEDISFVDKIKSLILKDLFPDNVVFEEPLEGICGIVTPYIAYQYYMGKDFEELTRGFAKGINMTLRDAFSVYTSLDAQYANILMAAYFNLKRTPVCFGYFDTPEKREKAEEMLLGLEDGIYNISLGTQNEDPHSILIQKDGDNINIVDPNIGLLTANKEKASKLLTKLRLFYYQDNKRQGILISKLEYCDNAFLEALKFKI